jgi:prepilin-type N-terminal cleavage/methylation domain-containing protein
MRRSEAGVTLLELLIAVTLVALLSAAVMTSIRVGLNAMERTNDRLTGNRRAAGAQNILSRQLAGFMPVTAECGGGGPSAPPQAPVRFFQGDPQSMRFVSSYSLQEGQRGHARILEFQVIPGEENRGVRLVVNERLYAGPRSAGVFCAGLAADPSTGFPKVQFGPIVVGPQSFVIADKLAFCRFVYREDAPPPLPEKWTPQWVRYDAWPSAIRLETGPLDPDPSRVQPGPATMLIRVTKDPAKNYALQTP